MVRLKTLQLAKQQGGWSLLFLRYYYFAAHYLQLRHYVDTKAKNITETSTGLIQLFLNAYNSENVDRIVSCLYKGLIS